jgi:hypothetical protein
MDRNSRNLLTYTMVMLAIIVSIVAMAIIVEASRADFQATREGPHWHEGLSPVGLGIVGLWIGDDGRIESEVVVYDGKAWLRPGLPPEFVDDQPPFAWKELP